ncbi:MAG: signal peptide peptidase SppA [Myxococcales bacterium]|nr:signal peptide peptidase SppA [Myxococcales bacterium]
MSRLGHDGVLCAGTVLAVALFAPAALAGEEPGLYVPSQSVANPDVALSILSNPAGFSLDQAADARVVGNFGGQPVGAGSAVGHNKGVGFGGFFAAPLGPLGVGAGAEWIDTGPRGIGVRSHFGASIALGETTALGAAVKWSTLQNTATVRSWDCGMLLRPAQWLSLGATLRNLGDGDYAGLNDATKSWPTRLTAGLGVRPLKGTDRLTASAEVQVPLDRARLAAFAALVGVKIATGVDVFLEHLQFVSDGEGSSHRTALGLSVGLGQTGVMVAMHRDRGANLGQRWGTVVAARLSADLPPSVLADGQVAVSVMLRGELVERRSGAGTHFGPLLLALQQLSQQPATRVVVLKTEGLKADWAQVEELREVIATLRKAGKKVLWYADELGTRGYGIATACDQIWLAPGGLVSVQGVGADFVSLAEALTRVGVAVQVVRYGEHKSAGEPFVNSKPSPQLAASLDHAVQRRWQDLTTWVQLAREISPAQLESALMAGAVYPEDAKAARLIDAVVATRDLDEKLHLIGWLTPTQRVQRWSPSVMRSRQWGSRPEIAVVEVEGAIGDHREGTSVLGRTLGGAEIAAVIENAQRDDDVKAVVARIVSPGGSVYGSEAMREALAQAAKVKPTLASMGGVAASGGFWTALGADTVFADRATVTGSIGIVSIRPSTKELYEKFGIRTTAFGAGPGAGMQSMARPYTEAEVAILHRQLGKFYGMFLQRTAERRKLDVSSVDELAGGRIWFGDEALQRKLIDRQGGLLGAIALAKTRAGLSEDEQVRIRFVPTPTLSQQLRAAVGLASAEDTMRSWTDHITAAAGPWLDVAAVAAVLGQFAPMAVDDGDWAPRQK